MFEREEAGYEPKVMDEHTEGKLRGALVKMADAVGIDTFQKWVDELMLNSEARIRAECAPGSPAYERLESAISRRDRGFE